MACQRRQVAAQEGVGGQLFVQLPRQRGLPLGAQQQRVLQAPGYPFIVGFGLPGKVQVGDGVFVGGVDLGVMGQGAQPAQRIEMLLQRAVEDPATTCQKQCVATKQRRMRVLGQLRAEIGEMVLGVARGGHDLKAQARLGDLDDIAMTHGLAHALGRTVGRPDDTRRRPARHQFGDAVDVVVMMVGDKDGSQRPAAGLQAVQNRLRLAGVDHHEGGTGADAPDVVVLQRRNRNHGTASVR